MTPAAAWFLLGTGFGVLLLIAVLAVLDYIYWRELMHPVDLAAAAALIGFAAGILTLLLLIAWGH